MTTTKIQWIREVIEGQALKHPEIDVLGVKASLIEFNPKGDQLTGFCSIMTVWEWQGQAQPFIEMGAAFVILFFRLYEPIIAPSHQWSGPSNFNAL